jgi:ATF/CREB family transcription factor
MFPAPSPNSQLFAQLAGSGATPGTLDFHRTALSAAAAAKREGQNHAQIQPSVTSQPQDMPNGNGVAPPKTESKAFDPHDNDAANGLFMLAQGAQGRNGAPAPSFPTSTQPQQHAISVTAPAVQPLEGSPPMPNGAGSTGPGSSIRGGSEGSEEMERSNGRAKGKKNGVASVNGRRKADEPPAKAPASKKAKTSAATAAANAAMMNGDETGSEEEDDDMHMDGSGKSKMTDEEKRKNFLERNRYVSTMRKTLLFVMILTV